jgi:hypothetical protein
VWDGETGGDSLSTSGGLSWIGRGLSSGKLGVEGRSAAGIEARSSGKQGVKDERTWQCQRWIAAADGERRHAAPNSRVASESGRTGVARE